MMVVDRNRRTEELVKCAGCKTIMTLHEFFKHKCPTPGGHLVKDALPKEMRDYFTGRA